MHCYWFKLLDLKLNLRQINLQIRIEIGFKNNIQLWKRTLTLKKVLRMQQDINFENKFDFELCFILDNEFKIFSSKRDT